MKKVLLMLVTGAFISASMISCSKCGHCVVNGVTTISKTCAKDNQTLYDAAKLSCTQQNGSWENN